MIPLTGIPPAVKDLPQAFSRGFGLGFILPATLFTTAIAFLLQKYTAFSVSIDALRATDISPAVYSLALLLLAAVVLLSRFNRVIYLLLQGYLPPLSWNSRAKRWFWSEVRRQRAEAQMLRERFVQGDLLATEFGRYTALLFRLSETPSTQADILPTRFGNAIRSFETYAHDVYGADGVAVWLRLLSVASTDYASAVKDACTEVDFHVNCCMLALVLAVSALGVGLAETPYDIIVREVSYAWQVSWYGPVPVGTSSRGFLAIWSPILQLVPFGSLLWFVAACLAARIFYGFAVATIPAWGDLVKAGFDCYLPKLADQLGYKLPHSDAKRREFWRQFSEMVTYRCPPGEPPFFRSEDWLFPPRR